MPMRGEDYWMVAGANISYLAVALRVNKKSSCLTDLNFSTSIVQLPTLPSSVSALFSRSTSPSPSV
jgi:hypothetical protein